MPSFAKINMYVCVYIYIYVCVYDNCIYIYMHVYTQCAALGLVKRLCRVIKLQ